MSGWLAVRGTSELGDLDLTQQRWHIMKMDTKKEKEEETWLSEHECFISSTALCCWKPQVESLPHNWPESLIITRSWGAACVSGCLCVYIYIFAHIFYCIFMCVCVYRKYDTPHPTLDKKGPVREECTANHMAGQARCPGLGPYGRSGGLASSGSQDSEGNSGRMGRLEPAGHQPTMPNLESFAFLSLKALQIRGKGGMLNDTMQLFGSV